MIASLIETCKLNSVDPLALDDGRACQARHRWPASKIMSYSLGLRKAGLSRPHVGGCPLT